MKYRISHLLLVTMSFVLICHFLSAQTISGLKYQGHYSKNDVIGILGEPDRYECEYDMGEETGCGCAYLTFVYGQDKYIFEWPYPEDESKLWYEEDENGHIYSYGYTISENDKPFLEEKGCFCDVYLGNPGSTIEFPSCRIRVGDDFDRLCRQRIGLDIMSKAEHYCSGEVYSEGGYYYLGLIYHSHPSVDAIDGIHTMSLPSIKKLGEGEQVEYVKYLGLSISDTLHFDFKFHIDMEFLPQEPDMCRIRQWETENQFFRNGYGSINTLYTYRLTYDRNFVITGIEKFAEKW